MPSTILDEIIQNLKICYSSDVRRSRLNPEMIEKISLEGDFEEWTDSSGPGEGYLCRIKRSRFLGCWLGYVRVPEGHPAYGKHYDNIDVDVHGGLTFSDYSFPGLWGDDEKLEGFYWIGFDCGHGCDYSPGLNDPNSDSDYKDKAYVTNEVKELVKQLEEMKN